MITDNSNSLENFVERHRADFDVHEPRPDLWAALAEQLDAPAEAQPLPAGPLPAAVPPAPGRRAWSWSYGLAAALAVLVMAAGAGEAWKMQHPAAQPLAASAAAAEVTAADAGLGLTELPDARFSDARGDSNTIRLASAVRGMETYYRSQLDQRQAELAQLSGPGVAGMTADLRQELASLDSSYRQLRQQLPTHPQPEAVLTAMNRNLQLRLDMLDQQLHLGTGRPAETYGGAYVLADSRQQPLQ